MSGPQVAGRTLPEGRYGTQPTRRGRRWRVAVFVAVALAVGGAVAYVGYRNFGTAPIEAERTGYAEQPGNSMRITFTVTRDQPGRPAVCIVRVRDITGNETGRKEVLIPPGGTVVQANSVIQSGTPPVTADVFGCSYQVPEYLSTEKRPTG